jgi:hypothetical protein
MMLRGVRVCQVSPTLGTEREGVLVPHTAWVYWGARAVVRSLEEVHESIC